MPLRHLGLAALPLLALAACQADESGSDRTQVGSPSATATNGDVGTAGVEQRLVAQPPRAPSILDDLRLSDDEERFVYETWQTIAQRCMAQAGFDYFIAPFETVNAAPRLPATIDEVRAHGYSPIEPELPPAAREVVSQVESDTQYRAAFVGDEDDPTDGCRDAALLVTDPVDGEYQQLDATVERAKIEVIASLESLPEYVALDESWARCMTEQGYFLSKPADALTKFVGVQLTQEQVDTRLADLNCQAAVAYEQTLGLLELDASERWIAENQGVVDAVKSAKAGYVDRLLEHVQINGLGVLRVSGLDGG